MPTEAIFIQPTTPVYYYHNVYRGSPLWPRRDSNPHILSGYHLLEMACIHFTTWSLRKLTVRSSLASRSCHTRGWYLLYFYNFFIHFLIALSKKIVDQVGFEPTLWTYLCGILNPMRFNQISPLIHNKTKNPDDFSSGFWFFILETIIKQYQKSRQNPDWEDYIM